MSVHDLPAYIPTTPPLADEGWPLPPGADDAVVRYRVDGTIQGVDYVVGGGIASAPEAVEAGLWDVTMRRYYDAWRRLRRLAFLCIGPITNQALEGVTFNASNGKQTFAWIFGLPATVDGDAYLVDWSDPDNGNPFVVPQATFGTALFDAHTGGEETPIPADTAAIGQVTAWEIVSDTTARVWSNKPLDVAREGVLWFCVESKPPVAPHIRLRDDAAGPWFPDADALTRFWFGRGAYQILAQLPDVYKIGRDDAESIGYLIGLPGTAQTPTTLILDGSFSAKTYFGQGSLRHRTGIITDGIETFENFADAQARLELASAPNTDAVGLLALINATTGEGRPAKQDPSGGASATNRSLLATAPGYDFERAVGMRRIGTQGFGEASSIGGVGERGVQRARRRLILSPSFAAAAGVVAAESTVEVYDPPEEITGLPFDPPEAAAVWRLPGYCTDLAHARERAKTTATIAALDASTPGELAIEFELGESTTYRVSAGTNYPENYDTGGNVVCPPLSWESRNIGATGLSGDRQRLLTPGDVVRLPDGDGTAGAIVLEAVAFGGDEVAGMTAPSADADGIPQSLRDNHARRDRIVVSTAGPQGARFASLATVGDTLSFGGQAAIAPHAYNVEAVSFQIDGGAWEALLASEYYLDPVDGRLYLSDTATATWTGTVRLRADVWLFDRRIVYPCEVANVLHGAVDGACEGYVALDHEAAARMLSMAAIRDGGDVISEWWDPLEFTPASDPGDVAWEPAGAPVTFEWTYGAPSGVAGIGVALNAEGGFLSNIYTLTAKIIGVTMPIPRQWLSAEIATAVCDIVIESPARYVGDNDDPTGSPPDSDFTDMRLIGYIVQTDEHGAVTSLTPTGASIPLSGLVYNEGDDVSRGTVDITAIMRSLAGRTFTDDDQIFMALAGPWGDPAALVASNPVALFRSFFRAYTYNPALPISSSNPAATVERITYGALSVSNIRLQPNAAALAGVRIPIPTV